MLCIYKFLLQWVCLWLVFIHVICGSPAFAVLDVFVFWFTFGVVCGFSVFGVGYFLVGWSVSRLICYVGGLSVCCWCFSFPVFSLMLCSRVFCIQYDINMVPTGVCVCMCVFLRGCGIHGFYTSSCPGH